MRTGASTVPALIANPAVLWMNPQFGPEGSPAVAFPAVGGTGVVPIYSPATGTVYEFDDGIGFGASLGQVSSGGPELFTANAVASNPTVDALGAVYVTANNQVQKISPAGAAVWNQGTFADPSGKVTTDPFVPNVLPGATPSDVYFGGAGTGQVVGGATGTVYAVTDADVPAWAVALVGTPVSISSNNAATLAATTLYVITTVDTGYDTAGTHLYALDALTGAFMWPAAFEGELIGGQVEPGHAQLVYEAAGPTSPTAHL